MHVAGRFSSLTSPKEFEPFGWWPKHFIFHSALHIHIYIDSETEAEA